MPYDETANASEVEIGVGEEFEISLAETRTAGYRWSLKSGEESVCSLLTESAQPTTGAVGGSGRRLWRFRAAATGICFLEFEYRRSWETSSEPARTFALKVRVRP